MTTKKTTRKASAALGWYPTMPAVEASVIDMATGRQVSLRARLRNHYWLHECRPLTQTTIDLVQRKLVLIDPADALDQAQLDQLLSDHFGFNLTAAGWTIPDLDEAYAAALESVNAIRERAIKGGRASADARSQRREQTPAGGAEAADDF